MNNLRLDKYLRKFRFFASAVLVLGLTSSCASFTESSLSVSEIFDGEKVEVEVGRYYFGLWGIDEETEKPEEALEEKIAFETAATQKCRDLGHKEAKLDVAERSCATVRKKKNICSHITVVKRYKCLH